MNKKLDSTMTYGYTVMCRRRAEENGSRVVYYLSLSFILFPCLYLANQHIPQCRLYGVE